MKRMKRVGLLRTLVVLCCVSLLQTLVPINTMAQQTTPDPATSFELGESPLSENEMDQLMLWIAAEVSAARVPYCYRQSFTRGAGEFPNAGCRPDQELNGALCYPKCQAGYEGKGPVCWMPCPAGLTDIGAFCQKSKSYTRGAGYVVWDQKKCEAENPHGCEKKGLIWYPNCKPGFTAGVTECYQKCPAGWADTVTGCTKPSYGRTAGEPMLCRAGLERVGERDALLCYPPCNNPNYTGIGPVCWQTCPTQYPTPCGVGCSTTKVECATTTTSMVTAPFIALISIISLGTTASLTATGKAWGLKGAKLAAEVQKAQSASKGAQLVSKLKGFLAAKNILQAKNFDKAVKVVKYGIKVYVVASAAKNEIELFTKEFDDDFENRTTKKVAEYVNTNFGPEGRRYIQRRWAVYHLNFMFEADAWATAQNVVSAASAFDPSGVSGVVSAYLHPVCKDNVPPPPQRPRLLYTR